MTSKGTLGGDVAIEVSHQLAEPLRGLRDRLGLVVDHLERHVAHATGPTPYPYHALQALRQDLAGTYLEATQLARRIDELDRALKNAGDAPRWFDLAATVDLGIRLAGHDLASGVELLIDLGNVAPARGAPGALALLVAQLISVSAASARALAGSSLSIRVSEDDAWGVVLIADNGNGAEVAEVGELGELARDVVTAWGGTAGVASTPGQGCTFELRLPTQP